MASLKKHGFEISVSYYFIPTLKLENMASLKKYGVEISVSYNFTIAPFGVRILAVWLRNIGFCYTFILIEHTINEQ